MRSEGRAFLKMHGLGNDFVVVDARTAPFTPSAAEAAAIADRRFGVGCDQLIVLEPAKDARADLFMHIYNADGGEAEACGNATRCVARLLIEEGRSEPAIETPAGLLACRAAEEGQITADMGPARLDWREIPLAEERDTLHLGIEEGPLRDPVGVSMGNPHAVFFVEDAEAIDLATLGPKLEHHPLFPERANIEAVQVLARDRLRLRVWERGGGITLACGSGACAAAVAAVRRDLAERRMEIVMDGGPVTMEWRKSDGHVLMTGSTAKVFEGRLDPALVPSRKARAAE